MYNNNAIADSRETTAVHGWCKMVYIDNVRMRICAVFMTRTGSVSMVQKLHLSGTCLYIAGGNTHVLREAVS